jgi:hypothetical protein
MATRAQSLHAEEQRHGVTERARKRKKARKTRAEKLGAPHEMKHAGKKASYAREVPSAEGRSSRKSTRSSANRAKPDTNLNLREEREKGSPENRFRKAKTRGARVRGAPAE